MYESVHKRPRHSQCRPIAARPHNRHHSPAHSCAHSHGALVTLLLVILIGAQLGVFVTALAPAQATTNTTPTIEVRFPDRLYRGAETTAVVVVHDGGGAPVAGKTVVVAFEQNGTYLPLVTAMSDMDGFANPRFTIPDLPDRAITADLIVNSDGEELERTALPIDDARTVLISTDKPIYQPGQTIHVRALSLAGFDPIPNSTPIRFEITDPDGNLILKRTLTPDQYGITSFDFPLADQLAIGTYELQAVVGALETTFTKTVRVEHYVLPTFEIEIEGVEDWYLIGDTIAGTVECRYFFGKPVAGTVEIDVDVYYGEWSTVEHLSGALANGAYAFTLEPITYAVGVPSNQDNGLVELRVTVTDEGGHTEEDSALISVARDPIQLSVVADKNLRGARSTYHFIAKDAAGRPVPDATIRYAIGAGSKTGDEAEATTDSRGLAPIKFTYEGQTEIRVNVTAGNRSVERILVLAESAGVKLVSDTDRYAVGATASFEVVAGAGTNGAYPQRVYYDVVAREFMLTSGIVALTDGRGTIEVPITADLAPLAQVRVYALDPETLAFHRDVATIGIDDNNGLSVTVTPSTSGPYAPHAPVDLSIQVEQLAAGTNSAGTGSATTTAPLSAPAALGVSIVDESVFELGGRFAGLDAVTAALEAEFTTPQYLILSYVYAGREVRIPIEETPEVVYPDPADAPPTQQYWAAEPQFGGGDVIMIDMPVGAVKALALDGSDGAKSGGDLHVNGAQASSRTRSLILFALGVAATTALVATARRRRRRQRRSNRMSPHSGGGIEPGILMLIILAALIGFVVITALYHYANPSTPVDPDDIDGDGIPNDQDLDRDGDGYSNALELAEGTDPGDPLSKPSSVAPDIGEGYAFTYEHTQWAEDYDNDGRVDRNRDGIEEEYGSSDFDFENDGEQELSPYNWRNDWELDGAVVEVVIGGMGDEETNAMPPQLPSGAYDPQATESSQRDRPRQYFPETWYWSPLVITDANGQASLSLTTPDSITSWAVDVMASTATGAIGTGTTDLTVFKPFFIEPDLPVEAVRGDTFPLDILVYNYDETDRTVTVTLSDGDADMGDDATAGPWYELPEPATNTQQVDAPAGSVTSARFVINATRVGTHTLKVEGDNGVRIDTVLRPLRVVPDGKALTAVTNGELSDNATSAFTIEFDAARVPYSADAWVKIQGGLASVLLDGADGFIQFVSGCGEQSMSTLSVDILAYQNLLAGDPTTEQLMRFETMVTQGIQHELMYLKPAENGEGRGIVWFPSDRDVHPWLTSWGLITLQDAIDAGFTVDPAVVGDMQSWLASQQVVDGSFTFPEWGLYETTNPILQSKKTATTAYIARALLYSGVPSSDGTVRDALGYVASTIRGDTNWNDPYTLAVSLIALERGGWSSSADPTLRADVAAQLVALRLDNDDGSTHWVSGSNMYSNYDANEAAPARSRRYGMGCDGHTIETTAYAILALDAHGGHHALAQRAVEYLLASRSSLGTFFSTQDTVVAFQALNSFGSVPLDELVVNVTVDDVSVGTVTITPANRDLTHLIDLGPYLNLTAGATTTTAVELTSTGAGMAIFQCTAEQYLPWSVVGTARPTELELDVTYDTTQVAVDDRITATVTLRYNGTAQQARMVLVDLRAPVGFAFDTAGFDALVADGVVDHYELTGRQLVVYLESVGRDEVIAFSYELVATAPITGTIQGVAAYDMYNPSVGAETAPVVVTATAPVVLTATATDPAQ